MSEHIREIAARLKELREICGYTTEEVAKKVSVVVADYEKFESGVVDIPVSVLCEAANCFGVSLTELLTGEKAKLHTYSLVKKDKGIGVERSKHYKYKALAYSYAGRKVEPLLVYVEPEPEDVKLVPNSHEGHEFHYCLEGRYVIRIGKHEVEVSEGDSLYFDSKNPHAMRALGGKTVKILVVVI